MKFKHRDARCNSVAVEYTGPGAPHTGMQMLASEWQLPDGKSPVFDEEPNASFILRCPDCGAWLSPSYAHLDPLPEST